MLPCGMRFSRRTLRFLLALVIIEGGILTLKLAYDSTDVRFKTSDASRMYD